jgi:hypothetical protein
MVPDLDVKGEQVAHLDIAAKIFERARKQRRGTVADPPHQNLLAIELSDDSKN